MEVVRERLPIGAEDKYFGQFGNNVGMLPGTLVKVSVFFALLKSLGFLRSSLIRRVLESV